MSRASQFDSDSASVADLVRSVRAGGAAGGLAFDQLVTRFQDMAMAYAYARLSDADLARDVTQEAFIDAYLRLDQLREPAAFPGWFRRIVLKHCDRILRRTREVTSIDGDDRPVRDDVPPGADVPGRLEGGEERAQLRRGLEALSESDRLVVVLHHLAGQSQREIAELLETSESAVKKRLFDARRRLKERIETMLHEELAQSRPSNDKNFSRTIRLFLAIRTRDHEAARQLLREAPELASATENWSDSDAIGGGLPISTKATPLIRAAEANDVEMIDLIIEQGGAVDGDCGCETQETALWASVVTGRTKAVRRLLEHGADANNATVAGHAPLHTAALRGNRELVDLLLEHGAQIDLLDARGRTAADWAELKGHDDLAVRLRSGIQGTYEATPQPNAVRRLGGSAEDTPRLIETGIKALDLFAPMRLGARIRFLGGQRVGRNVLLGELTHNWVRGLGGRAIWAAWHEHDWERSQLEQGTAEAGIGGLVEVLVCEPGASDGDRATFAEAAARHANAVAGEEGGPVLLVLFEGEGKNVDALTALGIASSDVTCIVVAAWQDVGPEPMPALAAPFDTQVCFDPELARIAHFPCVHSGESSTRGAWLDVDSDDPEVARFARVSGEASELLETVRAAASADPLETARAERLRGFMTQPFNTAESFVARPGAIVTREALLDGVEAILSGEFDDVAPSELMYVGGARERE